MENENFTGTEIVILEAALVSYENYQNIKKVIKSLGMDPLEDKSVLCAHCEIKGLMKALAAVRGTDHLEAFETFLEWKSSIDA